MWGSPFFVSEMSLARFSWRCWSRIDGRGGIVTFIVVSSVFLGPSNLETSMTGLLESEAVLTSRLKAAGLEDDLVDIIKLGGIVNLSRLAFVSAYTPGAADEGPLMEAFESLIGRPGTVAEKACFRRVFHEAYAAATSEMRQQMEKIEDQTSRRLTQPERTERYRAQVDRLPGVSITGANEPSDSLVDVTTSMYEENRLRWIDWSRCTSREQELQGEPKKDVSFSLDSSTGRLKVEPKRDCDRADTSTEVMLMYALTRRALAVEQANICSYAKMMLWTQRLMKSRMDEPPLGYARPSMKQLMMADQKLFMELADATRDGIQSTPEGRPVELLMDRIMYSSQVMCVLNPLPLMSHGKSESSGASATKPKEGPYVRSGPKGRSKGKSGGKFVRMPQQLIGCKAFTNSGEPICYNFNLKSCSEKVSNNRCSRGYHVCAAPKCGKSHPAVTCSLKPAGHADS